MFRMVSKLKELPTSHPTESAVWLFRDRKDNPIILVREKMVRNISLLSQLAGDPLMRRRKCEAINDNKKNITKVVDPRSKNININSVCSFDLGIESSPIMTMVGKCLNILNPGDNSDASTFVVHAKPRKIRSVKTTCLDCRLIK